jgi:hypothetical protein
VSSGRHPLDVVTQAMKPALRPSSFNLIYSGGSVATRATSSSRRRLPRFPLPFFVPNQSILNPISRLPLPVCRCLGPALPVYGGAASAGQEGRGDINKLLQQIGGGEMAPQGAVPSTSRHKKKGVGKSTTSPSSPRATQLSPPAPPCPGFPFPSQQPPPIEGFWPRSGGSNGAGHSSTVQSANMW